jgi:hypothetical protein
MNTNETQDKKTVIAALVVSELGKLRTVSEEEKKNLYELVLASNEEELQGWDIFLGIIKESLDEQTREKKKDDALVRVASKKEEVLRRVSSKKSSPMTVVRGGYDNLEGDNTLGGESTLNKLFD